MPVVQTTYLRFLILILSYLYVIFLSKGGMIDIRKNILSKSFAAQFHRKIPRVYKGVGKAKNGD